MEGNGEGREADGTSERKKGERGRQNPDLLEPEVVSMCEWEGECLEKKGVGSVRS